MAAIVCQCHANVVALTTSLLPSLKSRTGESVLFKAVAPAQERRFARRQARINAYIVAVSSLMLVMKRAREIHDQMVLNWVILD